MAHFQGNNNNDDDSYGSGNTGGNYGSGTDNYGSSNTGGYGGDNTDSFGSSARTGALGDDSFGSGGRTTGGGLGGDSYGSSGRTGGGLGDDSYGSSGNTGGNYGSSGTDSYGSGGRTGGNFGSSGDDTYGSSGNTGSYGGRATADDSYGSSGNTGSYGGRTTDDSYGSSNTGDDSYGGNGGYGGNSGRSGNNNNDSTTGKLLQKVGNAVGSDRIANMGAEKRQNAGSGSNNNDYDNSGSGNYGGSSNYYLQISSSYDIAPAVDADPTNVIADEIPSSAELHAAFQSLLDAIPPRGNLRGLLVTIRNEQLVPVSSLSSKSSDFTSDLSSLQEHLTPNEALYIILSRYNAPDGLVAVTYVPDTAPVRQKMLFASTRLTLTRELGTERFRETIFATTKEELNADGWKKHDSHVGLQAPLTEEERTLRGVKDAEAEEGSRGTGARSSHVSSGLSFPMSDSAVDALKSLAASHDHKSLVQLKIDIAQESIDLVSTTSATAQGLAGEISSNEPRYSFFRYEHEYNGTATAPVVFIYTCPSGSKIKERMLYASSRAGVISAAESHAGLQISKKFEATMPDEITEQTLHDEFHPKIEQKQAFSRPKRPGKK